MNNNIDEETLLEDPLAAAFNHQQYANEHLLLNTSDVSGGGLTGEIFEEEKTSSNGHSSSIT